MQIAKQKIHTLFDGSEKANKSLNGIRKHIMLLHLYWDQRGEKCFFFVCTSRISIPQLRLWSHSEDEAVLVFELRIW